MGYYDQDDVRIDIRKQYRDEYRSQTKRTHPIMSKFRSGFFRIGLTGTIIGVVGAVTAGIMAFCGAALALPVAICAAPLLAVGIPCLVGASKLQTRLDKHGDAEMEADIDNYKLVKSYVKQVLTKETKDIAQGRVDAESARTKKLGELDKQEIDLGRRRKNALVLLKKGMTTLESQAEAVQQDLVFFKQEAEHALGEQFDAATKPKQPAPLPTAAQSAPAAPTSLQSG